MNGVINIGEVVYRKFCVSIMEKDLVLGSFGRFIEEMICEVDFEDRGIKYGCVFAVFCVVEM